MSNKEPRRPQKRVVKEDEPDPIRSSQAPRYIVGIGASAGGLEALRALFGALKRAEHMALVVVQHLAPQHRSRLVELIANSTPFPVKEIHDGDDVEARTLYITPPNANVVLENQRLFLKNPESRIGPKPSVDLFFKSLAEDQGESAIGIVLSGTGSDGAQGIRAIKTAGGLTYCQKLDSAKYDGMPRAAKQTGFVDIELTVEEIAAQLSHLDEFAEPSTLPEIKIGPGLEDPFQMVLAILKRETKVDFSQYKQSTIRRRIERRIAANHCSSMAEYAELLRTNAEEARHLFQDSLISVTSFFRDEASFDSLGEFLVERIKKKDPGQNFRAWVVGCATGEEAYSVAILALEAMETLRKQLPIQIFATDLDEQAMQVARKALYPKTSLVDIPEKIRSKYFEPMDDQLYKVREFVRDTIVFARHDVTTDPPFLKLDLISCRNVLIYFNIRLQEQIIKTFNYALEVSGILFLGKSETTSAAEGLFDQADKNARLFYRSAKRGDLPRSYSRSELSREAVLLNRDREGGFGIDLFHCMVANHTPDSVLVDEQGKIRHLFGEANRYLNLPRGEPTVSITKLVPSEMTAELTALLHRASKSNRIVKGLQKYPSPGAVSAAGRSNASVQLSVTPLLFDSRRDYLVSFDSAPRDPGSVHARVARDLEGLPPEDQLRVLKDELIATREHLQTIIQEHETSNEELQALNEELQSSNEELQSTNEELETTNEELQSANEELTTLNQEINVKSTELLLLNQRLHAIQNAIFYPLLVVNKNLHLIEYNPAARYLFHVTDMDKGLSIKHLAQQFELLPALKLAEECLQNARESKLQFTMRGRKYEARVQLFYGAKGQVEGAVLSFVDNTDLVQALEMAHLHQERLDAILDNTPALVTMKDTRGCYVYVNSRFTEMLGKEPGQILGKTDEELFGERVGERWREQDFEVIKARKPIRFEMGLELAGKTVHWLASKFPLLDERRTVQSICSVSLDITERVLHEKQLTIFKQVITEASVGLAIFEGKTGQREAIFVSDHLVHRIGARVEDLLQVGEDDLLNRILNDCKTTQRNEIRRVLHEGVVGTFRVNLKENLGREDWVELRTSILKFPNTDQQYVLLIFFDINEQERARKAIQANQEEMARFSKLATMGELAAGISHEINTPLNVISGRAQLIEKLAARERLDQESLKKTSAEITRMVKNISAVVQGLKSLSGMESDDVNPVDLVTLIRETLQICDFKLQRFGVEAMVKVPPQLIRVKCNGVQVMQILINLINNAVDAISELSQRWIRIELEDLGSKVEINVVDSGRGIDSALAEKIMTPFFTTKKNKRGTGLGLSLSRTIARKHGGDLMLVHNSPNTCFQLHLPKTCDSAMNETDH
ncbi:MAG: chemotaxis protein CheB [Bdellovibrionales bacterium]